MERIYLDNAATSYPKAPGLGTVIAAAADNAANTNRTESGTALDAEDRLIALREALAAYYGSDYPEAIAFTRNVTEALNWVIKGFLRKGDTVIISSSEHNAVIRPLTQIGARIIRIPSDPKGFSIYSALEIPKGTKAIIAGSASNVTGAVQDLSILGELARKHGLMFFIDAAQHPADMRELNATGICFTGHKGLLGPMGTGGLVLQKEAAERIDPLISGGTGSMSDMAEVPGILPDRLSPGTENIPGLMGLKHSAEYAIEHREELHYNERLMTELLYTGLERISGITIHGPGLDDRRTNVISISTQRVDEADVSALLYERYGIETRVGLHCAPEAHRAIGTFPKGTLRFSPGPFTKKDEIDKALAALKEIMDERLR